MKQRNASCIPAILAMVLREKSVEIGDRLDLRRPTLDLAEKGALYQEQLKSCQAPRGRPVPSVISIR
jgi:hypothetical protein